MPLQLELSGISFQKHKIINSEMDIVRHFAKHFDQLPEQLRQASVKQLMSENPVTIRETTSVADAIKQCVVVTLKFSQPHSSESISWNRNCE